MTDGDGIESKLAEIVATLDRLGHNNADTRMGAVDANGAHIGEKLDRIASSLDALKDATDYVAHAVWRPSK